MSRAWPRILLVGWACAAACAPDDPSALERDAGAIADASALGAPDAAAPGDATLGADASVGPDATAGPDATVGPDAGAPCEGAPGTFHDQPITSGGAARAYFLHVPAAYRCDVAWPLLVDFHGTAVGARPEEAYATDALVETAEREGFIVARPRARSSLEGGEAVFRWDQNAGDLARNARLARELVEALSARYHLDPSRVRASGFSSGTNMIAQLAGDPASPFTGFGSVGGGYWNDPGALAPRAIAARHYFVTGYKDYLFGAQVDMLARLARDGVPDAQVFVRRTDSGHELYAWQLPELWAWIDRGERPPPGALAGGWTRTATLPEPAAALALARGPDGATLVVGDEGRVWRREARSGAWSVVGRAARGAPLVAVAALPSGRALAVGDGAVVESSDGGATWAPAAAIPELARAVFGAAKIADLGVSPWGRITAVGIWSHAYSDDGGRRWRAASLPYAGLTLDAQVAAVGYAATSSAAVAAGDYYLGRSDDGITFQAVAAPRDVGWLNDVADAGPGRWWVAGDHGALFTSEDDGHLWLDRSPPGEDRPFYAVDFWDARAGVAVGLGGMAWATDDGGLTWREVSAGLDVMLSDVAMTGPRGAQVVGDDGQVFDLAL